MSAKTFRRSFPNWEQLLPYVDPRFSSSFWRRVTEPTTGIDLRRFLIFGATSAIARGAARAAAAHGDTLYLVGRSAEKLAETAADLKVRGAARSIRAWRT